MALEEEEYPRAPGECAVCLKKCLESDLEYKTVLAGETKLPANTMVMVTAERLGLDDEILKVALDDGTHLKILELGGDSRVFEGLKASVNSISSRVDGKLYACGLTNGEVVIVRNDDGHLGVLRAWKSHTAGAHAVACLAFLASKTHVVSINAERELSLWDLSEASEPVASLNDLHAQPATCVLAVPQPDLPKKGKRNLEFVVGFKDGVCKRYVVKLDGDAVKKIKCLSSFDLPSAPLVGMGWLRGGEELVAAHGPYISVCADGVVRFTHQLHLSEITDLKCSRSAVVTCSTDGTVKVVDVRPDGWTLLQRLSVGRVITACVCDPENRYLGYADVKGGYKLFEVQAADHDQRPPRPQHRLDQPWGGAWERLMNRHCYREALIKACAVPVKERREFLTALRVLESLLECGLAAKAADSLDTSQLCDVISNLTARLTDHKAYWCQATLLSILRIVVSTNADWVARNAEEALVGPLHNVLSVIAPRIQSPSFSV